MIKLNMMIFAVCLLYSCIPTMKKKMQIVERNLVSNALASIESKAQNDEISLEIQILLKDGREVPATLVGDIKGKIPINAVVVNPPQNYSWLIILFEESQNDSIRSVAIACSQKSSGVWLYGGKMEKCYRHGQTEKSQP